MKFTFEMKVALASLLVICALCGTAALLLPSAHGPAFSYTGAMVSLAAVLGLGGMAVYCFRSDNARA